MLAPISLGTAFFILFGPLRGCSSTLQPQLQLLVVQVLVLGAPAAAAVEHLAMQQGHRHCEAPQPRDVASRDSATTPQKGLGIDAIHMRAEAEHITHLLLKDVPL